jgi:hypothetical protein
MYADNDEKIRRFLRDPEKNIWDDALLLNLWNDEQRSFSRQWGFFQTPVIIRVPPLCHMAHLFNWESHYSGYEIGHTYQALRYNWQTPIVCAYVWESQELGYGAGEDNQTGTVFTFPWEAYLIDTPAEMPPFGFPSDFHEVVFFAYDREPLQYRSLKEIQSRDTDHKNRSGKPTCFTIKDDFSSEFYLYPKPEPVWDDVHGEFYHGMLIHGEVTGADGFPYTFPLTLPITYGTVVDITNAETTQNEGVATNYADIDENILLVYRNRIKDIGSKEDSVSLPVYMQKYIEHAVLARAYKANTDGRIQSLADYWAWRKDIGKAVMLRYRYKRLTDRDLRLSGSFKPTRRGHGPRLPSDYPVI